MTYRHRTIDLVQQLRTELVNSGFSMYELARRAGVPYASVHGFVRDGRDMALSTAAKLCAVLHLGLRRTPRKGN